MKSQTLNLNEIGLSPLNDLEKKETAGGVPWLPAALAIALFVSAVNNFGDIRQGLMDGWNGTPRH